MVQRIGTALPVTFNLPFVQIRSAKMALRRDGTGTIALPALGETRIAHLIAWPHVRSWTMRKTAPALRSIPDAAAIAKLLSEAAQTRLSLPVISRGATGTSADAAAIAAQ